MRILIVGAGAVGQTYGYHLQRGGSSVAFFVKPKYASEARDGYTVYPLNQGTEPAEFGGFDVVTSAEEVAAERWDQVWLAVSSPALAGDWLASLLAAVGEATVVVLQPGLDDRERILAHVPAERVVTGVIAFIAWYAPLPGDERFPRPGVAWWFPPLTPSPFSGPGARAVVDALKAGGCPATVREAVQQESAFPAAMLNAHIAALESAGWSFERVRSGDHLRLASEAAQEAMQIAAVRLGRARPPLTARFGARPFNARLLLRLAPGLVPFDLEVYLRAHFTKVGAQTRENLETYIEHGKELDQPVGALSELLRRLDAARA